MPAGGSCLLGSINLAEFVVNPFTKEAYFDFEQFEKTVRIAVRALNNLLDEGLPLHPLQEQRDSVRDWRQIGLGIMSLADMLIKMKVTYGSTKSLAICDEIGFKMADTAINESALLAKEHGAFPKCSIEEIVSTDFFDRNTTKETAELVKKYGLRNSQLLTVAPTGTLSTMLGVSGGIEPIYAFSYQRKTESLHGSDVYYKIFTGIAKDYMERFGLTDEKDLPDFFIASQDINYRRRVDMQAVWQSHIDASISSTVNLPNSATVEDIEDLYTYAWQEGLKGITIYRDGCKRSGILTTSTEPEEEKFYDMIKPVSRSSIGKTFGSNDSRKTACGNLYLTVGRDTNGNIVETFMNTSKGGICKANTEAIHKLISLALRSGVMVEEIVDRLKGVQCSACIALRGKGVELDGISCPDIIGKFLEAEYKENEKYAAIFSMFDEDKKSPKPVVEKKVEVDKIIKRPKCPNCGAEIRHEGGCVTCAECGFSKCE